MTHTDDLIRLKDARISALELEINKLKEKLELSTALVSVLETTIKDYLENEY